jgi:hypothetical protein
MHIYTHKHTQKYAHTYKYMSISVYKRKKATQIHTYTNIHTYIRIHIQGFQVLSACISGPNDKNRNAVTQMNVLPMLNRVFANLSYK